MATIDIRNMKEEIDEIQFTDGKALHKNIEHNGRRMLLQGQVGIIDSELDDYMVLRDKDQVENMIKALQKAIELKWVK